MTEAHSPDSEPQRLAMLGHELRTPLNAIIGYAEAMTLQAFGPLPAPYGEHAATIHRAALHLLTLVDDLTDQAQAEAGVWAGTRTTFDPEVLAREVIELLASRADRAGVALSLSTAGPLGSVHADRRALRQILLNLLDNALKFTAEKGSVGVRLSREPGDLRLEIRDTGGGGGEHGPGLGLRLVRALVGAHGGAVDLCHTPDGGVAAVVRLPILTES